MSSFNQDRCDRQILLAPFPNSIGGRVKPHACNYRKPCPLWQEKKKKGSHPCRLFCFDMRISTQKKGSRINKSFDFFLLLFFFCGTREKDYHSRRHQLHPPMLHLWSCWRSGKWIICIMYEYINTPPPPLPAPHSSLLTVLRPRGLWG